MAYIQLLWSKDILVTLIICLRFTFPVEFQQNKQCQQQVFPFRHFYFFYVISRNNSPLSPHRAADGQLPSSSLESGWKQADTTWSSLKHMHEESQWMQLSGPAFGGNDGLPSQPAEFIWQSPLLKRGGLFMGTPAVLKIPKCLLPPSTKQV